MANTIDIRRVPRGREYVTSRHRLFNPAKYGLSGKVVELPMTAAVEASVAGVKRPPMTDDVTWIAPSIKARRENYFLPITAAVWCNLKTTIGLPVNLLPDQLQVDAGDLHMFEDWAAAFGYNLHHVIQNNIITLSSLS